MSRQQKTYLYEYGSNNGIFFINLKHFLLLLPKDTFSRKCKGHWKNHNCQILGRNYGMNPLLPDYSGVMAT